MSILHLIHATIMDADGAWLRDRTIGIRDGLIEAVIDDELAQPATGAIDLEGRIVLPGFGDAHLHVTHWGRRLTEPSIGEARSAKELLEMLRAWYREHPDSAGIFVSGFNEESWADRRLPDASDLDSIAPNIPVVVGRVCLHKGIVNTHVLKRLQNELASPEYAAYMEKDAAGTWTGRITETAYHLAMNLPRDDDQIERKNALKNGLIHMAELGFTHVASQDVSTPYDEQFWQVLETVYSEEPNLPFYIAQIGASRVEELDAWHDLRGRFSDHPKIRIGPLKLFKDGSLGARTALLSEPYTDDQTTRGLRLISVEDHRRWFLEAEARDIQVITHAIGDQAIIETCEGYAMAMQRMGSKSNKLRHAIVHAQITRPETITAIKESGMAVITQPMFIPSDREMAPARVGRDVYESSYGFGELTKRGIPQTFSSDAPIEAPNPFLAMAQVEDMTLQQKIAAYTTMFAYVNHMEESIGSLAPGMSANLTVVDSVDTLLDETWVHMTVIKGQVKTN